MSAEHRRDNQTEISHRSRRSRSYRSGINAVSPSGGTRNREAQSQNQPARRRPNRLLVAIIAMLALLAVGSGLFFGVPKLIELFTPAQAEPGLAVKIFIPSGSSTRQIAQTLQNNGVISNQNDFIQACTAQGVTSSLKPGTYDLTTGMDLDTLIALLVAGPPAASAKLTIPEGWTIQQTAARVEAVCGIPAADFIAEANNASKYLADYPFLADCYNNSLEGFLYPNTYQIPLGASAEYVVRTLLNEFAYETRGVDWSIAAAHGLSAYDVVVMASLIEKETAQPEERPEIASVIYNRLNQGMLLQIDATVIYALNDPNRDYAAHPLLNADLAVDSPYNTYKVDGLPVGPICSPQIASILAAAKPADTTYLYYVLTSKDGHHTFCSTSAEFAAALEVYNQVFGQ